MHFNWTQLIPGVGHHYMHVATLIIVSAVLILVGFRARVALGTGEQSIVPVGKISVRGFFEMITDMIGGLAGQVIGSMAARLRPRRPPWCSSATSMPTRSWTP